MTDAEAFTDIVAAFPLTSAQVRHLRDRAGDLLRKRPLSLSHKEAEQLRELATALAYLCQAAEYIENDTCPDDDIPF